MRTLQEFFFLPLFHCGHFCGHFEATIGAIGAFGALVRLTEKPPETQVFRGF